MSTASASLCLHAASIVALIPAPLCASDWYVDDDGDCTTGNGSEGDPFCKIQDAIDIALDGDVIHIAAGTYFEKLTIDRDVTLIGTDGQNTTVSGNAMTGTLDFIREEYGYYYHYYVAVHGGGIYNQGGSLTPTNSTVKILIK